MADFNFGRWGEDETGGIKMTRRGKRSWQSPGRWLAVFVAVVAVLVLVAAAGAAPEKCTEKSAHDEGSILDWPDCAPETLADLGESGQGLHGIWAGVLLIWLRLYWLSRAYS